MSESKQRQVPRFTAPARPLGRPRQPRRTPCAPAPCIHKSNLRRSSLMSVRIGLHHATRYQYDRPVSLGPQVVRLCPATHGRTRVTSYSLKVTPSQHFVNWQHDPNGNRIARFVFPEQTTEFSVTVDLVADLEVVNPFDFLHRALRRDLSVRLSDRVAAELAACLETEPARKHLKAYLGRHSSQTAQDHRFPGRSQPAFAAEDSLRDPNGARRPDRRGDARTSQGSCRDTAWLLVQVLRHLGLAGAVRVRLSHSAQARHQAARRARRRGARLHRSACLDRGLSAGRRLGRLRSDVGPSCAAKVICRWRRARTMVRQPRSAAWSDPPRWCSRSI